MHTVLQRLLERLALAALPAAFCITKVISSSLLAQDGRFQYPYAVFELPTLGGNNSYGWKVDESGIVIGSAFLVVNDFHPTLWLDGQEPVDLGTLGGRWGSARGINNNRWIVGRTQVE